MCLYLEAVTLATNLGDTFAQLLDEGLDKLRRELVGNIDVDISAHLTK